MDPLQPITIGSTRSKVVCDLAFCTLLIGAGLFTPILNSNAFFEAIDVIAIATLCPIALAAAVQLFRKPVLAIDADGLRWRNTRSWRVNWNDVGNFHIERANGTTIVVVDYWQDKWEAQHWFKRPPRVLPNTLQISPDELVAILQARLRVHGAVMPVPTKHFLLPTVPQGWSTWGYSLAVSLAGTPGMILAYGWVFPGTNVSEWKLLGRGGLGIASMLIFLPLIDWLLKRPSIWPSRWKKEG